jgi:hypothetical protein
MVCIEHYSKHIEAIPIPSKESEHTAPAFLHGVLARFGAPAEVITDRGGEFQGQFQELMEQACIDHRVTSANHPQADGLAERAVQTIKEALRKACLDKGDAGAWEDGLAWALLGYRCSPQRSTGMSPYYMLYAQHPTIPPAQRERLSQPLPTDDPEALANEVAHRAALVRKAVVMAGENLRIAQHRDTLRYAQVRNGDYIPRLRRYDVGDFVRVRHKTEHELEVPARDLILRVLEVRQDGTLLLQGKCGSVITHNVANVAPCHLPNIDPGIDPSLARPPADHPCEVCRSPHQWSKMLMCDNCNAGYHLHRLVPPLLRVPPGVWLCAATTQPASPKSRWRSGSAPRRSNRRRRHTGGSRTFHPRRLAGGTLPQQPCMAVQCTSSSPAQPPGRSDSLTAPCIISNPATARAISCGMTTAAPNA